MAVVEAVRDTNGAWTYEVECTVVVPGNEDIPAGTSVEVQGVPGSVASGKTEETIISTEVTSAEAADVSETVIVLRGAKVKESEKKDFWEHDQNNPDKPNDPDTSDTPEQNPSDPSSPNNPDLSTTQDPNEPEEDDNNSFSDPCASAVKSARDADKPNAEYGIVDQYRCLFTVEDIGSTIQNKRDKVIYKFLAYDSKEEEVVADYFNELCYRSIAKCSSPIPIKWDLPIWYLCLSATHGGANETRDTQCLNSTISHAYVFLTNLKWWTHVSNCAVGSEDPTAWYVSLHVLTKAYMYSGIVETLFNMVTWEEIQGSSGKYQPEAIVPQTPEDFIQQAKNDCAESLIAGWWGAYWRAASDIWDSEGRPSIPYNKQVVQHDRRMETQMVPTGTVPNVDTLYTGWNPDSDEAFWPELAVDNSENPLPSEPEEDPTV